MAIESGQEIIAAEGFCHFSARKVAKEIGYTIGTIYNIFESHEDFLLHINAATLEHIHSFILQNENKKRKGVEAIKDLATLYIRFAQEHYNGWSALFEFNLPQHTPLPKWYTEKVRALFSLVEAPLLPLLQENAKEAERVAKILWASIHGICQLSLTGKLDNVGAEPAEILTNTLIDNFMRGLK